jgi:uncharacterized membrane protein (TIGR02234 family)
MNDGREPPPRRSGDRRGLVLLLVVVLAGAAACAWAAALTWWTADYVDGLTGPLTVSVSGADCVPELVPLALVALAAFGAALATQGWPRRLIGLVLLAGGLLVAVRAATAMADVPILLTGALVRPADPAGPAEVHLLGPLLALAGGVLVAAGGAMITAGLAGRRRLGARYDAPAASVPPAMSPGPDPPAADGRIEPASTDPSGWWKALDAGTDPTDPAAAKGPPPGGYHDHSKRAR